MKLTLINSAFMIIVHSEKNLFDGIKRAIVPIHTKHSMEKMDIRVGSKNLNFLDFILLLTSIFGHDLKQFLLKIFFIIFQNGGSRRFCIF